MSPLNSVKNYVPINKVKNNVPINPLTAEWALSALIDFTLSNARRFYSSMGNPLADFTRQWGTPWLILLVNGEPLGRERVKYIHS